MRWRGVSHNTEKNNVGSWEMGRVLVIGQRCGIWIYLFPSLCHDFFFDLCPALLFWIPAFSFSARQKGPLSHLGSQDIFSASCSCSISIYPYKMKQRQKIWKNIFPFVICKLSDSYIILNLAQMSLNGATQSHCSCKIMYLSWYCLVDFYLNISESLNLDYPRNTQKLKTTMLSTCSSGVSFAFLGKTEWRQRN